MLDTAEKRMSAASVGQIWLVPGVTPNASKDQEWRQEAAWGYSGVLVGEPVVEPPSTGGGGFGGGYRHYLRPQEKQRPRERPVYKPEPIYGTCSVAAKAARITGRGTVDNSLPQLVMDEDEMFAGLLAAMG